MRLAVFLLLIAACKSKPPESRVQKALGEAHVPGISVAVVKNGSVTRTEAAGNVTAETPMEAASIAKTLIGIAVMQLVEQGKLDLDDDASTHLPFPLRHPTGMPITLRMLLTHRGSIRDPNDLEAARDPDLGMFLEHAVEFYAEEPGTKTAYSNMGASIAALAVQKTSGKPFDAYVHDAILVPVGAAHAAYHPLHAVYPVVDLWATAGELGALLAAIERGGDPILKSVDAMLDGNLGWQTIDLAGRSIVGHEGEDRAASTAMFFDRKTKSGAVVLTNGDAFASGDPVRAKALQNLLADLIR